ncbi:hypothetical protein JTE90_005711 [Oedothorax gibbosus]|uniref:Uncharacterized protein n=1 Tax=Oedothorax gibbosus TaxID=931172 RepID=A0AAV6TN12_9ARAC|nr:hypothetical protein JTE90_005711 [Oedothorax gibbosus]
MNGFFRGPTILLFFLPLRTCVFLKPERAQRSPGPFSKTATQASAEHLKIVWSSKSPLSGTPCNPRGPKTPGEKVMLFTKSCQNYRLEEFWGPEFYRRFVPKAANISVSYTASLKKVLKGRGQSKNRLLALSWSIRNASKKLLKQTLCHPAPPPPLPSVEHPIFSLGALHQGELLCTKSWSFPGCDFNPPCVFQKGGHALFSNSTEKSFFPHCKLDTQASTHPAPFLNSVFVALISKMFPKGQSTLPRQKSRSPAPKSPFPLQRETLHRDSTSPPGFDRALTYTPRLHILPFPPKFYGVFAGAPKSTTLKNIKHKNSAEAFFPPWVFRRFPPFPQTLIKGPHLEASRSGPFSRSWDSRSRPPTITHGEWHK